MPKNDLKDPDLKEEIGALKLSLIKDNESLIKDRQILASNPWLRIDTGIYEKGSSMSLIKDGAD